MPPPSPPPPFLREPGLGMKGGKSCREGAVITVKGSQSAVEYEQRGEAEDKGAFGELERNRQEPSCNVQEMVEMQRITNCRTHNLESK